jgi:hypothetical protein
VPACRPIGTNADIPAPVLSGVGHDWRATHETRLRIARAPHGATIGDVVKRTGSAWSAEEAAVANEVAPGDVLAGGRPVRSR